MSGFAAYFDESGIHDGSSLVVVSGYVATEGQWVAFDKKWRRLLNKYGVKVFHATDLENFREEYTGWDKGQRIAFQKELIALINPYTRLIMSQGIRVDDFNAVYPSVKDKYKGLQSSPYQLCCDLCWLNVSDWAKTVPDRRPVSVYFAQGNRFTTGSMRAYLAGCNTKKIREQFNIIEIKGVDMKSSTPAQAADFIAYETWKRWENKEKHPEIGLRKSLEALLNGNKAKGTVLKQRGIKYFLEQMAQFHTDYALLP